MGWDGLYKDLLVSHRLISVIQSGFKRDFCSLKLLLHLYIIFIGRVFKNRLVNFTAYSEKGLVLEESRMK